MLACKVYSSVNARYAEASARALVNRTDNSLHLLLRRGFASELCGRGSLFPSR